MLLSLGGCATNRLPKTPQLSANEQAEAFASFSRGLLSESRGQSIDALAHFRRAIRIDPREATLYNAAVESALALQDFDAAGELCAALLQQHPNQLAPHLLRARVLIAAGELDEAAQQLDQLARDFSDQATAHLARAHFYLTQDQSLQAIDTLETALKKEADPDFQAALIPALGEVYLYHAHHSDNNPAALQKGIELLERALQKAPDDLRILEQLGQAYGILREDSKSISKFKAAHELAPNNLPLLRQLLNATAKAGRIQEALLTCDELIRLSRTDPEPWTQYLIHRIPEEKRAELAEALHAYVQAHPDAPIFYHIQLSSIHLDNGQPERADRVLEHAREIYSENSYLQTALAHRSLQKEQYKRAHQMFQTIRAQMGESPWVRSPFFIVNATLAAQKSGQIAEAVRQLGAGFEREPRLLDSYFSNFLGAGQPLAVDEALAFLNQFQAEQPDALRPIYYKALLLASENRYRDALRYAAEFERRAPDEGLENRLNGFFYYTYAMLREQADQFEQAEALFRKAIALSEPRDAASAQNYIAYMWAEQGKKLDMSLELIQQALAVEPDNAAFIDTLGWIYYMKGDYKRALLALQRAVQNVSDDPAIWDHLGDTYCKLNDLNTAILHWKKARDLAANNPALLKQIEQKLLNSTESQSLADSPASRHSQP